MSQSQTTNYRRQRYQGQWKAPQPPRVSRDDAICNAELAAIAKAKAGANSGNGDQPEHYWVIV